MRARNIKPGFFTNADLVELPVETRLLFIGLWLMADRAGRLQDRPRQIKMELFPADSYDVDDMLDQLGKAEFIIRYEVDKSKYIQVVNFEKHQHPHIREKPSVIPPFTCKPGASPVQDQCETGANTSVARLIPDSGFLDSLIPDCGFLIPDSPPTPKGEEPLLPGIDLTAWNDFNEYRKSTTPLRKNWSPLAKRKAQELLAKHSPAEQQAMVDTSIRSGWSGLFPDKKQASKKPTADNFESKIYTSTPDEDIPWMKQKK